MIDSQYLISFKFGACTVFLKCWGVFALMLLHSVYYTWISIIYLQEYISEYVDNQSLVVDLSSDLDRTVQRYGGGNWLITFYNSYGRKAFSLNYISPLWALWYQSYNISLRHGRNWMEEAKRDDKYVFFPRKTFITLRYTQNYIYMFTRVSGRE